MSTDYTVTSMVIKLLKKIHSKNSSLGIALASQRKKYRPSDIAFWGQVFGTVMEIEKYYLTISFMEKYILQKNFSSIKSYIDLITYCNFCHKKSSERILLEVSKFFFSSNKEKRLCSSYLESITHHSLNSILDNISDPIQKWSFKYSLPDILFISLSSDFSTKELNLLGNWFNTPAPRYIWINNRNDDISSVVDSIKSKVTLFEIPAVKKSFIVNGHQTIQKTSEFKNNQLIIQDLGATIISQLVPKINGTIIDLCAAPGNKTIQLFDKYSSEDNCLFFAGDLPGSRFSTFLTRVKSLLDLSLFRIDKNDQNSLQIHQGSKRLSISSWDGTKLPFNEKTVDLVFIDAPCTGSGTLGSKPDVRLQINDNFISKHVDIQKKLLLESNRILKIGGFIYYTTCSLLKEEYDFLIFAFLENFPNYEVIPLHHNLNFPKLIIGGSIKLFPPFSKTDGFFAILLQKKLLE